MWVEQVLYESHKRSHMCSLKRKKENIERKTKKQKGVVVCMVGKYNPNVRGKISYAFFGSAVNFLRSRPVCEFKNMSVCMYTYFPRLCSLLLYKNKKNEK